MRRLEAVYRRLVERLSTTDVPSGALRSVIDGWFFTLEQDVLAEGAGGARGEPRRRDSPRSVTRAVPALDRLHPAVQHHVVNSLGWTSLRPLQEHAIEPLLAGEHGLIVGPTAGGKTEAAFLPLLSRMLTEDWRGLTLL